jgi:hypothetical protein
MGMARNRVQFQKGLSEAGFVGLYGTEELCREALARWRWPRGFELSRLPRRLFGLSQAASAAGSSRLA